MYASTDVAREKIAVTLGLWYYSCKIFVKTPESNPQCLQEDEKVFTCLPYPVCCHRV